MKTIRSLLIAALAVAFGISVQGQTPNSVIPPSQFPAYIPTATNMDGLYDWATTNQSIYPPVVINYIGTDGNAHSIGTLGILTNFNSYVAYRSFAANSILQLIQIIKTNSHPVDPAMSVRVSAPVIYNVSTPYGVTIIDTNAATLADVTFDWLMSVSPRYVNIMIPVPNLQEFKIEVGDDPINPYSNGWPAVINNSQSQTNQSVGEPHPPELTTSNWVVFNPWCLLEQWHARFSLMAEGQTVTYTQYGARMFPASTTITRDPPSVGVNCALGANTTLQCSMDLKNWVVIATISETDCVTNKVFVYQNDGVNKYFRSHSE